MTDAVKKFNIMTLNEIPDEKESSAARFIDDDDDGDDNCNFDANIIESAEPKDDSDKQYVPVSVPDGAFIVFQRISAVGTAIIDNKQTSIFYLDIRCNISDPPTWYAYRRYSQFRKLSDVLRSEGYYIPVLPPKRLIGAFSIEFIKQRKDDLEAWLNGVQEQHKLHPNSKDPQRNFFFRQFLTEGANCPPQSLIRVYPEHIEVSQVKGETNDKEQGKYQHVSHRKLSICYDE